MRSRRSRKSIREWAPWLHLGAVTVLGATAQLLVVASWAMQNETSLLAALIGVSGSFGGSAYVMLPIGAGASVAMVRPVTQSRLMRLAMGTFALMLVIDLASPVGNIAIDTSPAVVGGVTFADPERADFSRVSVSGTVLDLVTGELGGMSERATRYPSAHPRSQASLALLKGSLLLLPFLVVALVGGFTEWLDAHVTFHSEAGRRLFRVWIGWLASPVVLWAVVHWVERGRASALFGSGTLGLMLLPYVPLTVAAWLAWRHVPSGAARQRYPVLR